MQWVYKLPLIAHLADIHLGKRQYNIDFRENDVYELFNEAVDIALREHVNLMIISGDLFDEYRPRNKALKTAIEAFKKLIEHDIKIILMPGDHDMPRSREMISFLVFKSIFDSIILLSTPNDYETKYIDSSNKIAIYAIPYSRNKTKVKKVMPEFLNKASLFFRENRDLKKILMAHYSIEEFFPFDSVLSISDLPAIDYAAFGHIHNRILGVIPKGGVLGYPGSIDIFDARDINDWLKNGKGFYIVDISKDPDPSMVHKIDLNIRPQYSIEADNSTILTKLRDLVRNLDSTIKKPVIVNVVLKIRKGTWFNMKRLHQLFEDDVRLRIHPVFTDEDRRISYGSMEVFDERKVLSKYMEAPMDVAELVYELVEGVSEGNMDSQEIIAIINSIMERWDKAKNIVRLTFDTSVDKFRKGKERKITRRKDGLLKYL